MNISGKLNKFIQYALADGVLTEKEKSILLKNAIEEGNDADEFEMYLGALLFEKQQALKREALAEMPPPPVVEKATSNKEGDIKKCPSCGASVRSFQIKCDECGHEFRNIDSNRVIKDLEIKLNQIKKNEVSNSSDYEDRTANIIKNHPIPNTKEDLFEMLSYMSSKVFSSEAVQITGDKITNAYHSRALEVINKLLFMSDVEPQIIERVEQIKKDMAQHKGKNNVKSILIAIFMFILAYISYKIIYGPFVDYFTRE